MNSIFLSDTSTNLINKTNNLNHLSIIKYAHLGQIIYNIDLLSNSKKNIIYLANHNLYDELINYCSKIVDLHNNKITIIDINSIDIDKILNTNDIYNYLETNNCKYYILQNEEIAIN